jgi:hypothetical protein
VELRLLAVLLADSRYAVHNLFLAYLTLEIDLLNLTSVADNIDLPGKAVSKP